MKKALEDDENFFCSGSFGTIAFFSSRDIWRALLNAEAFTRGRGFIATLPEIVQLRIRHNGDDELSNLLWNNDLTSMSEEVISEDSDATTYMMIHGSGIMDTSHKWKRALFYGDCMQQGARVRPERYKHFQEVVLEKRIPHLTYHEFIECTDVPRQIAISLEHEDQWEKTSDQQSDLEKLKFSPLFNIRCGGNELALRYLETLRARGYKGYPNRHSLPDVCEGQIRSRLVKACYSEMFGFDGKYNIECAARFIGIVPE